MSVIYLGYDPGGGGAHGVASIIGDEVRCDTLDTANDAINWFMERYNEHSQTSEVVMGVDTLTLWSTGPAGWRPADIALREIYPLVIQSIQAPNTLRGAMPINGAAVVRVLGQTTPQLRVTETHPKVLYYALTNQEYDFPGENNAMNHELQQWIGIELPAINSDHEWDAVISAYVARQWATGEWTFDLHQLPQIANEHLIPIYNHESHYIWPKVISKTEEVSLQKASSAWSKRGIPSWRRAIEILEALHHDDIAQEIRDFKNIRNEKSGWDAWFRANYPSLWGKYEAGRNERGEA